jgi:large subunit ribosomal protein L28
MKVCRICGRHPHRGNQISRRGLAKKKGGVGKKITGISKRTFKPNLQRIRAFVEGKVVRVRVCAACIRAGKIVKPPLKHRPPKPKPVLVEAPARVVEGEAQAGGGEAPAPEAQEGKAGEKAE